MKVLQNSCHMPPESSGYIQVPGNPVLSSQAATYYKANVEKVIEFTTASKVFKNERVPRTALSIYRKARQIYADPARPARKAGALPAEK